MEQLVKNYADRKYNHCVTVTHKGTVVAFSMDDKRQIYYAVLDLSATDKGSELDVAYWPQNPSPLQFPFEIEQVGYELLGAVPFPQVKMGSRNESELALRPQELDRFLSSSARMTADVPFQVYSDNKHIFVFRQSISSDHPDSMFKGKQGGISSDTTRTDFVMHEDVKVPIVDSTLLCDCFVLSKSILLPAREVRFRRSRNRSNPNSNTDSLGAADMEGNPFYMPTRELAFVKSMANGCFDVVQLATAVSSVKRWQIFSFNSKTKTMNSFNFEVASDGLFNLSGTRLYTSPVEEYQPSVLERSPGSCPFTGLELIPVKTETGHEESCLDFSTRGASVIAEGSTSWSSNQFTVEMWVKCNSSTVTNNGLFSSDRRAGPNVFEILTIDNRYVFTHKTFGVVDIELVTDKWQHLSVTYNGNELKTYCNGELKETVVKSGYTADFGEYVFGTNVGANENGVKTNFNGQLDEIRVWDTPRPESSIFADSMHRLAGNELALHGYWRFDEGSGKTAFDQTDYGSHAQVTEEAAWVSSSSSIGDSPSMRRSMFTLGNGRIGTGLATKIYYQQESTPSGYTGENKPMKKQARLFLAMGTTNGESKSGPIAIVDAAISREGKIGRIPDVLNLPVLEKPEGALDVAETASLQKRFISLKKEIQEAKNAVRAVKEQIATIPAMEAEVRRLKAIAQQTYSNFRRMSTQSRAIRLRVYGYARNADRNYKDAQGKVRNLVKLRNGGENRAVKLIELETKFTDIQADLENVASETTTIFMKPIYTDTSGLTLIGGLLKFAVSKGAPRILTSASGQVTLYFLSAENALMATYYDVNVTRSHFSFEDEGASLSFLSRSSGTGLNGSSLEMKPGKDSDTCNLMLNDLESGITETWSNMPRDAVKFAGMFNGSMERGEQVAAEVIPQSFSVARRSSQLLAIVGPRPGVANNGMAKISEGRNTKFMADAPGKCFYFEKESSVLSLPAEKLNQSVPENAYTVEAWISPDENLTGIGRIVSHFSENTGYSLGLQYKDTVNKKKRFNIVGEVFLGAGDVGTMKSTSEELVVNGLWNHICMTFHQSYCLRFAGEQYLKCGASSMLDVNADLTIEVACKIEEFGMVHGLVGKGVLGQKQKNVPYQVRVTKTGLVEFLFEANGSQKSLLSTKSLEKSKFHKIGVVRKGGQLTKSNPGDGETIKYTVDGEEKELVVETTESVEISEFFDLTIFIDGKVVGQSRIVCNAPSGHNGDFAIGRCHDSSSRTVNTKGLICDVRIWKEARTADQMGTTISGTEQGLVGWWNMEDRSGNVASDRKGISDGLLYGATWEKSPDPDASLLKLFRNGLEATETTMSIASEWGDQGMFLAGRKKGGKATDTFKGYLEEVRVWNIVRTEEEVMDNLFSRLKGEKEYLIMYYSFDWASTTEDATHLVDEGLRGNNMNFPSMKEEMPKSQLSHAPISQETAAVRSALSGLENDFQDLGSCTTSAVEYADLQRDASGNQKGVLKRCYAYAKDGTWILISGFKVGNLRTEWMGQAQFNPQIMGYIEGAPPVPSENLTPGVFDTNGEAASIDIVESNSVTYTLGKSKEESFDSAFSSTVQSVFGSDDMLIAAPLGFGIGKSMTDIDFKVGQSGEFNSSDMWANEQSMGQGVNKAKEIHVMVSGTWEHENVAENPAIGRRAVPNNTGYALVQSGTADIYGLRMEHNDALVSFRMVPNQDIPPDWNMIPFAINPQYTKQGTLDGKLGYNENGAVVPDSAYPMATQHGEFSYYKPSEAYATELGIQREQQRHKSFYDDFESGHSNLRGEGTAAAAGAAAGMLVPIGGPFLAKEAANPLLNSMKKGFDKSSLSSTYSKRDLCNTYVWTAEGGFFAESTETSAVSTEETSGSFEFTGMATASVAGGFAIFSMGLGFEFNAAVGGGMSVTKTKTKETEQTFGLKVAVDVPTDLNLYERNEFGTYKTKYVDDNVVPVPGKVDAYRFKSFYLDSRTDNFDDLYGKVIDPIWLADPSNPNAIAMRQARQSDSKPPCWRVFHRVTFVSRLLPSLMDATAPPLEKSLRAQNIGSNWQLIQRLDPFVKDKTGDVSRFAEAVRNTLDRYLPELIPNGEEIINYLISYYGIRS